MLDDGQWYTVSGKCELDSYSHVYICTTFGSKTHKKKIIKKVPNICTTIAGCGTYDI